MSHDETLGQPLPRGTTGASATNRVDHGGCPGDLQALIQRQVRQSVRPLATTVWLAPTRGRRYLTKRGAIQAEARALIELKHPTEQAEYEQGQMIYSGWHWTSLPRADVLLRRVCRLVGKEA